MDNITAGRILKLITEREQSYDVLAKETGISSSALQRYATGQTKKISLDRLEIIAKALHTSVAYLAGWTDDDEQMLPGLLPIQTKKVPLLGTMACGEPVYKEEDFPSYVAVGNDVRADAAIRAEGDSMMNARILDGDIVFIRYQPTVENGEIAALWVDEGFTIKRVFQMGKNIILHPENPSYKDSIYGEKDCKNIKIIGKAVAFQSDVK